MSTTIKANEAVPGLDHRLTSLPARLTTAGIHVPKPLTDGLAVARWKVQGPNLDEYKARLTECTTEAEYQAVCLDLARDQALAVVMASPQFKGYSEGFRLGAAEHGLRQCVDDLLAETVDRYNAEVPDFTVALAEVPDLTDVRSAYDLTPEASRALMEAKGAAATLTRFLDVYRDLAFLGGYGQFGEPKELAGAVQTMTVLGSWESGSALHAAATDLLRYRAGEGHHGALAPHAVAAWHAEEFRLVLPAEAAERHMATMENWTTA